MVTRAGAVNLPAEKNIHILPLDSKVQRPLEICLVRGTWVWKPESVGAREYTPDHVVDHPANGDLQSAQ